MGTLAVGLFDAAVLSLCDPAVIGFMDRCKILHAMPNGAWCILCPIANLC